MSGHLWQLLFIHAPIEIDRGATVDIPSLPEIDNSGLVLSLWRNLSPVVLSEVRFNKSFFKCLNVNWAVFKAIRSLDDVRHPPFRFAATVEKLFDDLSVLGTFIGIYNVLGTGSQRLEYVSGVGWRLGILFCTCLRFLRLIYASTMNIRYLLKSHAPFLS